MPKKLIATQVAVALAGALLGSLVQAQDQDAGTPSPVYQLGQIQVTAHDRDGDALGGSVVTAGDLLRYHKQTVAAALSLVPGTSESNSGGSRNERLIYIRGFDRYQTTLSIDGIRVFLPADNRLDFSRFLTADLSEIQIAKGYVSVLDGPGGLGGAINLVTRKPTKPLEGELMVGMSADGQGDYNGNQTSAVLGTRQEHYYLQASVAQNKQQSFSLSDHFQPTTNQPRGKRINSGSNDWRLNLKGGWTPNATDEYSLNFIRQKGSKNAPYSVSDPIATQRYWTWPYWDIDSLAFLSHTQLGQDFYVNSKLYYNTFKNGLFSYDTPAQNTQTTRKAFRSYYDDHASGGSIEAGTTLIPDNTLKTALFYRRDNHTEWQTSYAQMLFTEPHQTTIQDTWSAALEDTWQAAEKLDVVGGISYDWLHLVQAEDYNNNTFVHYPLSDQHAFNWQAAVTYRYSEQGNVYANVSSRTRFPTLFERFSSRFGTAVPNPDIRPERGINYEIGVQQQLDPSLEIKGALFYSDLRNALIQVPVVLPLPYGSTNQTRNAGRGEYAGGEVSFTKTFSDSLQIGGNYTYIHRNLKAPQLPIFRPTGVPHQKLFAYLDWRLNQLLVLTPSVEAASDRWTVNTAGTRYFQTGSYTLVNLAATLDFTPKTQLLFGVRNLFDDNYQLVDGFPEEGRNLYVTLRMKL